MVQVLPEVPGNDPTRFCRLCFSEERIYWVIRTSGTEVDKPFIRTIGECLGIWLTLEEDFPCAVCRACSTLLEQILEFREKCRQCDEALKKKRHEEPLAMVMFYDYPEGRVFLNGSAKPRSVGNDPDSLLEPVNKNNTVSRARKKVVLPLPGAARKEKPSRARKTADLKKYFESYAKWKAELSAVRDDDEMTIDAPESRKHNETIKKPKRTKHLNRTKCCLCKRECKNAGTLKRHFQAKHRGFRCSKCDKKFGSYNTLKQHMMRHQKDWLLSCEKCGIQFVAKRDLAAHRKNEDCCNPALMCECEHCGRKFSRRGRYLFHMKKIHPDKLSPVIDDMTQVSAEKDSFYSDTRQIQLNSSHPPVVEKGRFVVMLEPLKLEFTDGDNSLDCSQESSSSRTHSALAEDFLDTFVCTLCFEQFDELSDFNHHWEDCCVTGNDPESSPPPPPPFVLCGCEICSAIFERVGQLEQHLQHHERPYEVKLHDCLCCQRSNLEPPERPDSPAAILGD